MSFPRLVLLVDTRLRRFIFKALGLPERALRGDELKDWVKGALKISGSPSDSTR
jgi:hypothetical protein